MGEFGPPPWLPGVNRQPIPNMRNVAFWAEKLAKAQAELDGLYQHPKFKPSTQAPKLKAFSKRRKYWRVARARWLRKWVIYRRWARRREYLGARISYYRERLEALTTRGERILRSPVI